MEAAGRSCAPLGRFRDPSPWSEEDPAEILYASGRSALRAAPLRAGRQRLQTDRAVAVGLVASVLRPSIALAMPVGARSPQRAQVDVRLRLGWSELVGPRRGIPNRGATASSRDRDGSGALALRGAHRDASRARCDRLGPGGPIATPFARSCEAPRRIPGSCSLVTVPSWVISAGVALTEAGLIDDARATFRCGWMRRRVDRRPHSRGASAANPRIAPPPSQPAAIDLRSQSQEVRDRTHRRGPALARLIRDDRAPHRRCTDDTNRTKRRDCGARPESAMRGSNRHPETRSHLFRPLRALSIYR